MGQPITVSDVTVADPIAAFATDRGVTGQSGFAFESADDAAAAGSLAGDLAARIFGADEAIDHVFVSSNQVVVGRSAGWNDAAVATISGIIEGFFVVYAG